MTSSASPIGSTPIGSQQSAAPAGRKGRGALGRLAVGARLLLAVAALLAACSPYEIESTAQLEGLESGTYPTILVAPPKLYFDHEAYQAYQLGTDLAELLSSEGRVPIMTGWEVDIESPQDGEVGSRVLIDLIDAAALSVTDVLLCEMRIDEARTTRTVQAPLQMGGGTQHHYQSDVTVTLTLRTATYREEVGRVTVRFEDPPFADGATAANPRPVLREGVREAGRALIERLEESFPEEPAGEPPAVTLFANPKDVFAYTEVDRPPLEEQFDDMDELDRLASRMVYYQYFDPDISGGDMRLFEASPPGLLVSAVDDDTSVLREGDYIISVNGQRVGGVYTFERAFYLAPPGSEVRLMVDRSGDRRVVHADVRDVSD